MQKKKCQKKTKKNVHDFILKNWQKFKQNKKQKKGTHNFF